MQSRLPSGICKKPYLHHAWVSLKNIKTNFVLVKSDSGTVPVMCVDKVLILSQIHFRRDAILEAYFFLKLKNVYTSHRQSQWYIRMCMSLMGYWILHLSHHAYNGPDRTLWPRVVGIMVWGRTFCLYPRIDFCHPRKRFYTTIHSVTTVVTRPILYQPFLE